MKRSSAIAVILIMLTGGCSAAQREGSSLEADLDGDGVPEKVTLVQSSASIVLDLQPSAPGQASQRLEFGIDAARQDALCQSPATLQVVDLVCDPMDEQLEGCSAAGNARGLLLADGQCDSIHLYWNHDAGQLWWWRL